MAPLRQWLGRAPAGHISGCSSWDAGEYADIPPFLLPLELRLKLYETRAAPYHKPVDITHPDKDRPSQTPSPRKRKRTMPSLLTRLTAPASYPIVVVQYKNEFRGVGHEASLHWALVVLTDRTALSGPSFQAYAQTTRLRWARRPRLSDTSDSSGGTASSAGSRRSTNASVTMGTRALDEPLGAPHQLRSLHGEDDAAARVRDAHAETDVQWYTRHGDACLFDVCATVRTLCLGGVQVGAIKAADVGKLVEYLRSHPPVPSAPGWCSRDYVLELLELLRPFKLLRADLQNKRARAKGAKVEVALGDLLPELRRVGKATQESIDREDYRPCVRYHSS
ncbi:hypothetical protein BD413DRAFT_615458 [Trametes elegans]|nr:hypothetical protein BD413DRAFT_615458 [Trametes elegans]